MTPNRQTIGILGGGQLAQMIADAALRKGHRVVALTPSLAAPAARVDGVEVIVGHIDDHDDVERLFASSDCVTIENEFLDVDMLRAIGARHPGTALRPGFRVLEVGQDKLAQKRLFARLGIPTARYQLVSSDELARDPRRLQRQFPRGCVLKWSRYGYDGHGNRVVRSPLELESAAVRDFCRAGEERGGQVYAEERIDFAAEVAMVSARAETGDQVFFPLVESRQEECVCAEVLGPAIRLGVAPVLERQTIAALTAIGTELAMCGSFALELFITTDGALLANELAPRVHNTGHYSLFGDEVSQFDLHVAAITGARLARPEIGGLVAMRNLLGPSTAPMSAATISLPAPPAGVALHWYGKDAVRPGRKMGHLTARADSPRALRAALEAMREYEVRLWTPAERKETGR